MGSRTGSRPAPRVVILWGAVASILGACGDDAPRPTFVLNGESNRLNAYAISPEGPIKQTVIQRRSLDASGWDINGQICFHPDGSGRFIKNGPWR